MNAEFHPLSHTGHDPVSSKITLSESEHYYPDTCHIPCLHPLQKNHAIKRALSTNWTLAWIPIGRQFNHKNWTTPCLRVYTRGILHHYRHLYNLSTDLLFHEYEANHQFIANDICRMHKEWLGNIYEWAGQYRSVNISKDDFAFAMAAQIQKLMNQLESNQLKKYTPCKFEHRNEIVKAIAEVHTELVLIHPFREGNGRCSRILASIMALQAGLPVLNFSIISRTKKSNYFTAVQFGMDLNYEPMEKLFAEIIENSIQALST